MNVEIGQFLRTHERPILVGTAGLLALVGTVIEPGCASAPQTTSSPDSFSEKSYSNKIMVTVDKPDYYGTLCFYINNPTSDMVIFHFPSSTRVVLKHATCPKIVNERTIKLKNPDLSIGEALEAEGCREYIHSLGLTTNQPVTDIQLR